MENKPIFNKETEDAILKIAEQLQAKEIWVSPSIQGSENDFWERQWMTENRFHLVDVEVDLKTWFVLPSIEVNLHAFEVGITWMCFGVYFNIPKKLRRKK